MPVFVRMERANMRAGRFASDVGPSAVRRKAARMLDAMRLGDRELSILLCDDGAIHALNRDYRHKDKPTDVLAFAMREGEYGAMHEHLLGDIVISIDTAARQARERGFSLEREVTTLLAHGLLHLLGFDHRDRSEERRMNALTDLLRAAASARRKRRKDRARDSEFR